MNSIKRETGRRKIDKIEAMRHLLHAAIRMSFQREDPFAIHMLVQSADKLTSDFCQAKGIADVFRWEDIIREEHLKPLYKVYRETYNYFKHSDKDADRKLEIHDISASNNAVLFAACLRFHSIAGYSTRHTQHYVGYYMSMYPSVVQEGVSRDIAVAARKHIAGIPAHEILSGLRNIMLADPSLVEEFKLDVADAIYPEVEL